MAKDKSRSESKSTSNNVEKPLTRKRKRAQRNKERLLNHQSKLLDNFAVGVNLGFSEENWNSLAKLYRQISDFLDPDERRWLGQLWRESYACELAPTKISEAVDLVKARLLSPTVRSHA